MGWFSKAPKTQAKPEYVGKRRTQSGQPSTYQKVRNEQIQRANKSASVAPKKRWWE